ncbi:MAG: UDP-glucose 4-epimerase GalE [Desulfobacteraceae bacterium]|nr:UDP-glucose 4-epimerase GalE [Desulfobacteraceae bacterium]
MKILVTGGAGYIGSHTCVELLDAGYEIVIVDNLSNSSEEVIKRIKEITRKDFIFLNADLRDRHQLSTIFKDHKIDAVIHFAGLKAVGESVELPLKYYQNNIEGTLSLLDTMNHANVKTIVFSSSATVYGNPETLPIKEDFPLFVTNPYGRTKLMIEEILKDLYQSDNSWDIALLRYFNPVGAHKSGEIGENPLGLPNNLMPYICKVAANELSHLNIFGSDYDTPDGTGVRDYIHVVDLALGHIKILPKLFDNSGLVIYNIGTGKGYSVLEMVKGFEKISGAKIPYKIVGRRPGDIASCYADPSKANAELDWKAVKTLYDMCQDTWHWLQKNPKGYNQKKSSD